MGKPTNRKVKYFYKVPQSVVVTLKFDRKAMTLEL